MSLEMRSEFSDAQGRPSVSLFLMPEDPDIELTALPQHHAWLHAAMFPAMTNPLHLYASPVTCFPDAVLTVPIHSNETLTKTVTMLILCTLKPFLWNWGDGLEARSTYCSGRGREFSPSIHMATQKCL